MATTVTPFLMFQGRAEEAVRFYASLFEGEIVTLERYDPKEGDAEGAVRVGELTLHGQRIRFIDSPTPHDFDFTPSFSLFVDTTDDTEFERLFASLSEGGQVLMPPGDYGFSRRFAWANDRFGVSWQISLND